MLMQICDNPISLMAESAVPEIASLLCCEFRDRYREISLPNGKVHSMVDMFLKLKRGDPIVRLALN
jgi:hypothetical protein